MTNDLPDDLLTLTIPQTAAALGIGTRLTYDLVRRSVIPALRLGRRWVVPRAALAEYLETARSGGSQ
jgi:excisionase family DNA binding protein